MTPEEMKKREEYLKIIADQLPPIVFRNWSKWREVLPFSSRTVANEDCLGLGPKEKVFVGKYCGYPKDSMIDYLRKKISFQGHSGR